MGRHAGPGRGPSPAPPREPTHAERARTLVHLAGLGTLSTLSRRHPGHPFGSLMPYAQDGAGAPLLLVSGIAAHTQNLEADPRASLLVAPAGPPGEDPLALGRVTLMGRAARVPPPEVGSARAAYLARHPQAAAWADFGDFAFWRLEVADVYFVGGFAAMGWVDAGAFLAARPDPLAEEAAGILEHVNREHSDALVTLARELGGEEAAEAWMVAVDRLGFKLRLRSGEHRRSCRVAFPREITSAAEARAALAEMLGAAHT